MRRTILTALIVFILTSTAIAQTLLQSGLEAIRANDAQALALILDRGLSPDSRNSEGSTLLMVAAGRGHTEVGRLLVQRGADLHALDSAMGVTALHRAAQSGNVELMELFLDKGAFIDDRSAVNGHTPLLDAAFYKRYQAFDFLLRRDANLSLKNTLGLTVHDWAQRQKDPELLKLIAEQQSRDEARKVDQKLIAATLSGDTAEVKKLLEQGHSERVDEKDKAGMTALLWACRNGHPEIAEALLAAGADPNITDRLMRATPGHKAAFFGRAGILRALCQAGLKVDAQGPYNGYTALHDAILNSHVEAARVLVEYGASDGLQGHDGKTPRGLAEELGIDKRIWP